MKRCLDILVAVCLLVVFALPIAIIALLIRMKIGSPVVFKQERPGLYGKRFVIRKFRTMTDERDETGQLLPDQQRMTKFGHMLRKYSLDELLQLWNVLKGDLSLVGPRPLLMEYLPLYNERQNMRHDVKPGITGWAQVNGRNAISWEEKFELDVWYVENQSFLLDLKILFMTAQKVWKSEGISQQGHVTIEKFRGSNYKKVMLIGSGGHSKVVSDIVTSKGYDVVGYLDDRYERHTMEDGMVYAPIMDAYAILTSIPDVTFVLAIGNNTVRKKIVEQLSLPKDAYVTLVHPNAVISPTAHIAQGTVVMAGAIVQADATIGSHCIINTGAIVEHDNVIGNFVHISPHATLTGNVRVEEGTHIGAAATIIPSMVVGSFSVVGAGAVVTTHIPAGCTAVGVPARIRETIGG